MNVSKEFINWVENKYGSCVSVKQKAQREGVEYFYNSYTNVEGIDLKGFKKFFNSNDCVCSENCKPLKTALKCKNCPKTFRTHEAKWAHEDNVCFNFY